MATWPPDETIWPQVRAHRWKYARRTQPVRLILMHATRGRVRMALQYPATKNWQVAPSNKVVEPSGAVWGSMSSRIISHEGQHCISIPDEYHPTWSAGHMDPIAISYELAQPSWQSAFTPACLERAALEVARDCLRYDIPPVVLPYVSGDNHEAPGIARHDRSANGRKWGKSDPGRLFDDRAFEARVRYHMEALTMSDAEKELEKHRKRMKIIKALSEGRDQDAVNAMVICLGVKPRLKPRPPGR